MAAQTLMCESHARNPVDGDEIDMTWDGVYTWGESWCRGTGVYLKESGGSYHCFKCNHQYRLLQDDSNHSYAMRAESIDMVIDLLGPFDTSRRIGWILRSEELGRFLIKQECECVDIAGFNQHQIIKWNNQEAVLAELRQVAAWAKLNNVTQEWI
jgi:hypothetical protein